MNRAALAVALVAASSGVASAGTYIGVGIGTAPTISEDIENDLYEDGRSGRILLGHRIGRFAIEGALGKYSAILSDNGGVGPTYDIYQGSISGKFSLPLGDGFEAFGRLGFHKQWFGNDRDERYDVSGTGLVLGAGFEYRFKASLAGGFSIFVDYQYSRAELEGETFSLGDTSTRMWTLGATIGF